MVKQLRQVAGVRRVKVVDFKKGHFVLTPSSGVRLSNSAISAAVSRSGFTLAKIVPPGTASGAESSAASLAKKDATGENGAYQLAPAREAFRKHQYAEALKLAREIATANAEAGDDRDAARRNARVGQVQQLLSLTLFALGKYDDAAAAAHAGLHHGKAWDWKTLKVRYATTADYTSHLRGLENSIRKQSTPAKRFLIGYHYLMLGQPRAARAQFARAAKERPDDVLIAKLLEDLAKEKNDE